MKFGVVSDPWAIPDAPSAPIVDLDGLDFACGPDPRFYYLPNGQAIWGTGVRQPCSGAVYLVDRRATDREQNRGVQFSSAGGIRALRWSDHDPGGGTIGWK